ncbi:hypothetical protein C943_00619 [Mariniradius saccharolyticus AK6]|uniref:Uncharacterized protein n=1 Tax=Mariniradius saccharolyticus AK6 TaxID=1239962 RepID=M7Y832_9BACT|nr:hypothetical protein C943_00619 [Mariniradius saccharolyticus AK6]
MYDSDAVGQFFQVVLHVQWFQTLKYKIPGFAAVKKEYRSIEVLKMGCDIGIKNPPIPCHAFC